MEYSVRRYTECPVMDTASIESSDAYKALAAKEPEQAALLRHFLCHPNVKSYHLATPAQTKGRYAVWYVRIEGGQDFPTHTHDEVMAVIFIAEGRGYLVLNGEKFPVQVGDVIHIPPGTLHEVIAEGGPLGYLACVSPDLGQDGVPDIHFG